MQYYEPFKYPEAAAYPEASYTMHIALAQDHMAWETAGPVANRTEERLATSDQGIVMYREMLRREIQKVQQGNDPICVIRSAEHPVIDTGLGENLERPVFNEIYRVVDDDRARTAPDAVRAYERYQTVPRGSADSE